MASKPGVFTEWPWQRLGTFKYVILAPWVANSVYQFMVKGEEERDLSLLMIFPALLVRVFHTQLWLSLARFQTARGNHRIVNKGLEFDQVDREMNWDDQILLSGLIFYIANIFVPGASHAPWWDTKGVVITILIHIGPVEFLYYWLHRALHHHFLYSRYHSHHHASIVTEPITSVIHPFIEEFCYFSLFSMPFFTMAHTRSGSMIGALGYVLYIDFMNYMGHCNYELVPKWLFQAFPLLKYLMYTPSFHSLHHTQFRTNYSLFMPFYDYIYGTMDKSTDDLYEAKLKGKEETLHIVHLTHLTSLESIYHLRFGLTSLASKPYTPKLFLWLIWPFTYGAMLLTWISRSAFTLERNKLKEIEMQTWVIPRYTFQYKLSKERDDINDLIEKAIMEADERGAKVVSLGLLNQDEELNRNGELYLEKNPKLKIRIVDGTSLATAIVLNSIPNGTTQVLLKGKVCKTSCAITIALCKRGVKVWLVGDGLTDEEQRRASKGSHFIPFTQFPPKKARRECIYYKTPAMVTPKAFENMHACENWLPRRAMSAWRVAGIVHALEGWGAHDCGVTVHDIEKVWRAALDHGFLPLAPSKLGLA